MTHKVDLDRIKMIYILAAPPGIEDIDFDEYVCNDFCMDKYFKEFKLGITPEQTILIKIYTQEKHKQYSLQHSTTRTIHSTHGEKLISMEI